MQRTKTCSSNSSADFQRTLEEAKDKTLPLGTLSSTSFRRRIPSSLLDKFGMLDQLAQEYLLLLLLLLPQLQL